MNNIGKNSFDIDYMETLASGDSVLHRLDPRAKLITTFFFIIAVVSFDKYTLSGLTPFFIYPAVLISLGGLPLGYILKRLLVVSPFAILVGIFNPLIDKAVFLNIGPINISGGWISFFSIFIRFVLTVSSALILVSLTGFNAVCASLLKLRVPRPFVIQLLFFYRYIFVLIDEAERMTRAAAFRSFDPKPLRLKIFTHLAGQLLLRTLDRAERIYCAMCSRGFDGSIHVVKSKKTGRREIVFVLGWVSLFVLFRIYNISAQAGKLFAGDF